MKISDIFLGAVKKLEDRGWDSQDSFFVVLVSYVILCFYFAFIITLPLGLFGVSIIGASKSLLLAVILTSPFKLILISVTYKTYRKLGRI